MNRNQIEKKSDNIKIIISLVWTIQTSRRFAYVGHKSPHKEIWHHTLIQNLKTSLWIFFSFIWCSTFSLLPDVRFHFILVLQHSFFTSYLVLYTLLVLLTSSCKFEGIYFHDLLFCYRVCYCVGLFSHQLFNKSKLKVE